MLNVVPPIVKDGVHASDVYGEIRPVASAAWATIGLNVEPVG